MQADSIVVDQSKKEKAKSKEDQLVEIARGRFKIAEDAESESRKLRSDDLEFSVGNQWPEQLMQERQAEGRPCHVVNRLPQHIRQITNDQRQNKPSIKVSPIDDKADVETGKILQGLVRHIEQNSIAEIAYNTAFDSAVRTGLGYFRILTNYVSPQSFEQEILIKRINNTFSVYLDPFFKEPDASDAEWCFIFDEISKEQFEREYGDSKLASCEDWSSLGAICDSWMNKDSVRIAEYFYKEYIDETLVLLSTGESLLERDLKQHFESLMSQGAVELPTIKRTRKTKIPIVKWCKLNGHEILEETEFPGVYIPVIPVLGEELDINGKRHIEGIVRQAKDSQRQYNFWTSNLTETIALAPRVPYIAAEGQIPKAYENQWKNANRKNYPYLVYKPIDLNGQALPAPQRQSYEPPVQAISMARMQSAEDIKATTGIYDAALGNQSNETSGKAIRARQSQAQTSNFHFVDNLSLSIRHAGRIIVGIIPFIYDTARAMRIIGEEGEEEIVYINQEFARQGQKTYFDIAASAGKYDVAVETGPSIATRRQEAALSMMDFTKAIPSQGAMISDLIAKNMDWPGSSEIAERLKKLLPPGIAEDKNQKPIPPEVQGQLQQMDQMIQQLTEKLNEANEREKTKMMELESKERIETMKLQNSLVLEQMKLQGAASNSLMMEEIKAINNRLALLDINNPINDDFPGEDSVPQGDANFNPNEQDQQFTGELPPGTTNGEYP